MHTGETRLMRLITLFVLTLCLLVIALGAYTRLKDAGLGCPDWPLCYGEILVPSNPDEIAYPDSSSFDRSKAWIEVVHRMAAGLLGLAILLLLLLDIRGVVRNKTLPRRKVSRLLILLCLLVMVQSLFGMWTVTLRLLPQVVTTHLLGGMTILSLIFLYMLNLRRVASFTFPVPVSPVLLLFSYLGLVLLIAQIALGGWVSANYAALACPDFPLCNGAWLPPADFAQGFNILSPPGPNYEGGVLDLSGRTAIHLTHRYGAVVLLCYWGGYYFVVRRLFPRLAGTLDVVVIAMLGQLALGITNVLTSLPLFIALAHNLGAAFLLLAVIALLYNLHYANDTASA